MDFWTSFRETSEQFPDKPALVTEGGSLSYSSLRSHVKRFSTSLLERGVGKGDRIATILPNNEAMVTCYLAAARLGAVLVPLNLRYRRSEIEYMLRNAGARALVSVDRFNDTDYRDLLSSILPDLSVELYCVDGETPSGATGFESMLRGNRHHSPDRPRVAPDDGVIVFFTSGTTGRPKPALVSHANVLSTVRANQDRWDLTHEDVGLMALPNNHVGGANVMVATCLTIGCTVRLFESFDAERILTAMEEEDGSYLNGVPTMYSDLVQQARRTAPRDTDAFRLGVIGGASPAPRLVRDVMEVLGGELVQGWGMSETSGYATSTHPGDPVERHASSIGVPMQGCESRIVDPEAPTQPCDPGQVGELLVRGPMVFQEYMGMPDETRASFEGEWFRTGDLVRERDDGYLQFVERKHNMYVSGGYNVYPREVENELENHGDIDQVCVVEVPDERWGEVGWAYVRPYPGKQIEDEDLREYCRDRFADYKIPRRFLIMKELPMTPSGKIAREELRSLAMEEVEGT